MTEAIKAMVMVIRVILKAVKVMVKIIKVIFKTNRIMKKIGTMKAIKAMKKADTLLFWLNS